MGKAGLGLCGLDQTGRTLSTYQGSCDRIHSVFLVLFWLGMDLEKQKDGATDMHVWNCLEWKWGPVFSLDILCQDWESLGRSLFFTTLRQSCLLSARRRKKTIITVGGHECTLRLIPLLRFEVTQQDMGSILHLTMRRVKKKKKKGKKTTTSR